MKKHYYLLAVIVPIFSFAQVGINTTTPLATLDVNGNLIVRTVNTTAPDTTYNFLVQNQTTKEVEKITGNLGTVSANSTIAKAVEENGVSLLSGSLFAGWQKIDFGPGHVNINPGNNFSAATDFYTVPATGIYQINYEFRYGNGVLLSALNFSGTPSIGILNHSGGSYTVLDKRKFSGANVPFLVSLLISNSSINSIYQLTAGDQLSFEVNAGGLGMGALSSSYATFSIRKISD